MTTHLRTLVALGLVGFASAFNAIARGLFRAEMRALVISDTLEDAAWRVAALPALDSHRQGP